MVVSTVVELKVLDVDLKKIGTSGGFLSSLVGHVWKFEGWMR